MRIRPLVSTYHSCPLKCTMSPVPSVTMPPQLCASEELPPKRLALPFSTLRTIPFVGLTSARRMLTVSGLFPQT